MYNTTTKSYTLEDAGGSYSWIFENIDRKDCQELTDDDINAWVDQLIDHETESDTYAIEERAEQQSYPRYGYTTAEVFGNSDDWLAWKKDELKTEMQAERTVVFALIKNWIAESNEANPDAL